MKVCVFCASSERVAPLYLRAGFDFGRELARRGHELVYGGCGRGVMGAVARGARSAGAFVTGVVPGLFSAPEFIFDGCTRVVETDDLRARKAFMQAESDAFAVLPGGVGTYDELFDTMALVSLGQLSAPVAALDVGGFFGPLRLMLEAGEAGGFIGARAARVLEFRATPGELLDCLERSR